MHLTFLGTAAAEGYPNAFCDCANCERARVLGGLSLRKRSSVLVNDDLLIDLGPDAMVASSIHGVSLTQVSHCLQTHAHDDHLDPSHFLSRSPDYGVPNAPLLHFYASRASVPRTAMLLEPDFGDRGFLTPEVWWQLNLEVHEVAPFRPFDAGLYQVTAYPASHDPTVEPLLFTIERDGRAIFYGTDTGALSETTWTALERSAIVFDIVVLDHTHGVHHAQPYHLNASQFIEHVARLREMGRLAQTARIFATHIWHAENPPHPELSELARDHGYEIPFDGLVVKCQP